MQLEFTLIVEEEYTASRIFSTAEETVSSVGVSILVSTAGMVQESASLPRATRDKGKAIMTEFEPEKTTTKARVEADEELTQKHQIEEREKYSEDDRTKMLVDLINQRKKFFTQQRAKAKRNKPVTQAQQKTYIARVEADEELTQKHQTEEREKYSEDDRTKMLVDLINQRKKFFTQQRAEAKRKKPVTQAQQKTYMSNYIKHVGSYTLKQLKKLSFEEIKELFEVTMRRIQDFVPIEKEGNKEVSKLAGAGGSKRDAKEELDQGSFKKQKTDEASGSVQEQPVEEEKELSQEDLQQLMIIAPEQGMNVEALQVKYPLIDWEIYTEDSRKY
nr:hypothetical protein [Tanacetum cinerariifolium]